MAEEAGTDLLGELPLDIRIRTGSDAGQPIMVTDPEGDLAASYRAIASCIIQRISALADATESQRDALPTLVME